MKFAVFNTKDADEDIRKASRWHEEQQAGLGFKFLDDVENILIFLEDRPAIFQKKHGEIREAPLKKFPFVVLFRIEEPDSVTVFAFFHTSKNPKKKTTYPFRSV